MNKHVPQYDRLGYRLALHTAMITAAFGMVLPLRAPAIDVLTQHNDLSRTGANLSEGTLTPSVVNVNTFGKVITYAVDGSVYAQPLYVGGLAIAGGTHNVCYVATMEDSVYAFDADRNTTFWRARFTGGSTTPVPIVDITGRNNLNIHGNVGILSTPVIDRRSGTIYVLARTKNTSNRTYQQQLHALNLLTGAEKFGGPKTISASGFDSKMQSQRPGLALANGKIYIAWGSHEDLPTYHGWMMAYDATTLAQTNVFNTTPGGSKGAIWQAGQAPAVDSSGNLYVLTGNGDWNGSSRWGESFLKLNSSLKVTDWFTPANFAALNRSDVDFGAGGALLVPGTNFVLGGGKEGKIFVLDKGGSASMGHQNSRDSGARQIWQAIQTSSCSHHIHGSPIYWNSSSQGKMIYVWGENDVCKAFKFNGSTFATTPFTKSSAKSPTSGCGMPGSILSLSANGSDNGIVWANCVFQGDALHNTVSGMLRAYDANNLGRELWNSLQNKSRDDVGNLAKYVPPTVVNGKVYMASFSNRVNVYGRVSGGGGGGGGGGAIAAGTYKLINRSTGKALDNNDSAADGTPVIQYPSGNSNNQRWAVTLDGGVYKLRCVGSGKYLDSLGNTDDGDPVGQWAGSSSSHQNWTIADLGSGFYKVTNSSNGKSLDSAGAAGNDPIVFWTNSSSSNQQWQFVAP